jgi:AcrR family transcriptional regulator
MSESSPDKTGSGVGLRERNVEARRQRILQAARVLLAQGGLGALSMRKLAEEASLSVNTLYNLWGTREEILRALTLDAKDRIDAVIPRPEPSDDPVDRCRLLVRTTIRQMIGDKDLFRPMILAWLEGEIEGHPSPVEPMARSIHVLSRVIEMAREQGALESSLKPEHVASQIHHGAQFAAIQWALGRIGDTRFEARALYGVNLALLGIVSEDRRPEIRSKLKGLERRLRASTARPS